MADYIGLYITQLPRARDISSMLPLPPPPKLDASTANQPYSTADQIHRLSEHHYQHQRQHQHKHKHKQHQHKHKHKHKHKRQQQQQQQQRQYMHMRMHQHQRRQQRRQGRGQRVAHRRGWP
eukprot:COSAG04_NODE_4801_length_1887_cov_21.250559_3_plen_121_part_00